MEKAILSVSYGTTDDSQLEATVGRVEEIYKKDFPDYEIRRAFTSSHVLAALKRAGRPADTVDEALDKLHKDGFDEVAIQPTHILAGGEYDQICEVAMAHKGDFRKLCVGRPLLDSESDNEVIVDFFEHELATANHAILLMGHGTVHHDNIKYSLLQNTAKRRGYNDIFVFTLEAEPSVHDIIPTLKAAGFSKVILTPLLFGAAGHAKRDMAGEGQGSVASILRDAGFDVECLVKGLGEYPEFAKLYASHLRAAIEHI